MELKEFIAETIKQIAEGTEEGDAYIKNNKSGIGIMRSLDGIPVKFDIAVTSGTEKASEIGGKITVANVFSAGGKKGNKEANSNFSRIQFELILRLFKPNPTETP
jgi:hypothetical protein